MQVGSFDASFSAAPNFKQVNINHLGFEGPSCTSRFRFRFLLGRRLNGSAGLLVEQHRHELLVVDVPVAVDVGLADQLLALL